MVCMYVQRSPFVEMPMGSSVPTGPRGGTHRARGSNIPTPRYHRHRVTHTGSYLRTNVRFLSQLYFRQLRVSCVLLQEVQRHTGPKAGWERGGGWMTPTDEHRSGAREALQHIKLAWHCPRLGARPFLELLCRKPKPLPYSLCEVMEEDLGVCLQ